MLAVLFGLFFGMLTLGQVSPLPHVLLWCAALLILFLLVTFWLVGKYRQGIFSQKWHAGFAAVQFFLALMLGAGISNNALHQQLAKRQFSETTVTVAVEVIGISQSVGERVRQVVAPVTPIADLPAQWLLTPAYQSNTAQTINNMQAGQIWQLTAKLSAPHGVAAHGVFSEQRWLLGMGVGAKAAASELSLLQQPSPTFFSKHRIAHLRLALRKRIENLQSSSKLTQDKAVLLALLTGDRALVSRDTKVLYQNMGISHLLAISGPHVLFAASMFAWVLIKLLNFLPHSYRLLPRRSWVMPSALLVALAYALLAGWDIPAQRTVLMFAIATLVSLFGKQLSVWWVLLVSANVILLADPLAVLSAAFWLSFVAVGLLVLLGQSAAFSPLLQDNHMQQLAGQNQPLEEPKQHTRTHFANLLRKLKAFVLLQFIFFVCIVPVSLVFFGQVSWLMPVVNLFAIPVLGLVVVPLNILAFLLDFISPALASMLWQVLLAVLHIFHTVLYALQHSFPKVMFSLHLDKTALWAGAAVLALWLLPITPRLRWLCVPLLLLFLLPRKLPAPAVVTGIDGTGFSAVLVRTSTDSLLSPHKNLLYIGDVNPQKSHDHNLKYTLENVLSASLRQLNVHQLDVLVISATSHTTSNAADNTTSALLSSLQENIPIKHIYTSSKPLDKKQLGNKQLDNQSGSELSHHKQGCQAGQRWQWGQVQFDMLAPWENVPLTGNDTACVLRIALAKQQPENTGNAAQTLSSILLMGNSTKVTQKMLLALCADISTDVLMLPQQGSKAAHLPSFIQATAAKRTLVVRQHSQSRRAAHTPHLQTRAYMAQKQLPLDITADTGSVSYFLGTHKQTTEFYRHHWRWLAVD